MKKKILPILLFVGSTVLCQAQLIKNDFMNGLAVGANLETGAYANTTQDETNPIMANQWSRTGKTGTGNQGGASPVVAAPLTYDGYTESGKSNAFQMERLINSESRFTIYSLVNDNTYNTGTYYVVMMAKVEEVGSSGGSDFFSLDGNYTANNQRAKLFFKNASVTDSKKFSFGISDDTSAPAKVSEDFTKGETFLLVLKYDFTDTPDSDICLFVNPTISETEPTPTISMKRTTISGGSPASLTSIRGITFRQRTTSKSQIGGIRFAQTWQDAIGHSIVSINNDIVDNGVIVSTKYYNLSGHEVKHPTKGQMLIQKDIYENGVSIQSKVVK